MDTYDLTLLVHSPSMGESQGRNSSRSLKAGLPAIPQNFTSGHGTHVLQERTAGILEELGGSLRVMLSLLTQLRITFPTLCYTLIHGLIYIG